VIVFRRKSRLVSFRVSEEEYENLRRTAAVHGVRGISDIARFALRKILAVPIQEQDALMAQDSLVEGPVTKLTQNLDQLTHRIDEMIQRLDLLKEPAKNRQL
jgi:hypothetical protein